MKKLAMISFLIFVFSGCAFTHIVKQECVGFATIEVIVYSLKEIKSPNCQILIRSGADIVKVVDIDELIPEYWGETKQFGKAMKLRGIVSQNLPCGGYDLAIVLGHKWKTPPLGYIRIDQGQQTKVQLLVPPLPDNWPTI